MSNPYVDMVPQAQTVVESPNQVYVSRIQKDAIQDPKIKDGLDQLFDMGFVDYDINLTLLYKYGGEAGAAAEHLLVHGITGILD